MKKVLSLCVMCLLTLSAMSQKTVWVDLDLPSGTKWKSANESGLYSYESAIYNFGMYVPTIEQWQELRACCVWTWQEDGYRVTGNNGNSIFLPAAGHRHCNADSDVEDVVYGFYWSSTPAGSDAARYLYFGFWGVNNMYSYPRCISLSLRLVQ